MYTQTDNTNSVTIDYYKRYDLASYQSNKRLGTYSLHQAIPPLGKYNLLDKCSVS